ECVLEVDAPQVDNGEGRAESRAGGNAEEVGVGERVPEHALVRGSGRGEHGADQRTDDDARHTDGPEDRVVGRRQGRADVEERDPGGGRLERLDQADVDGPDERPDHQRDDEEERRRQEPEPRGHLLRCASAAATARTKSTIRGPQRDAIESSMRTIVPVRTAATRLHPGRAPTVRGVWAQQRMSARTTMSGLCEPTYSGESFG